MLGKEQEKKIEYSKDYLSTHRIERIFQEMLVEVIAQKPRSDQLRGLMVQTLRGLKEKKAYFKREDFEGMFESHDALGEGEVGFWLLNQGLDKLGVRYSESEFLERYPIYKIGRMVKREDYIRILEKEYQGSLLKA
jgi:hypothetical protein